MKARADQFGYEFDENNKIESIKMYGIENRPFSIRLQNGTFGPFNQPTNIFTYEYDTRTKVKIQN